MVETAIAIGLILSLFFIDSFGLAAGGIVVPGYFALQLSNPLNIVATFIIAIITSLIVKLIGKYSFLYGRRQMVLSLLIGLILALISHNFMSFNVAENTFQLEALGWVIPGLIAHWMAKQGVVKTISMLIITSVIVRFSVILMYNGSLIK
ncbi:MAG: poly-gamma-glutamate biosynthesis protein PgsC [Paludibacteraceae bacterium]